MGEQPTCPKDATHRMVYSRYFEEWNCVDCVMGPLPAVLTPAEAATLRALGEAASETRREIIGQEGRVSMATYQRLGSALAAAQPVLQRLQPPASAGGGGR